jgi:hypothetical protein
MFERRGSVTGMEKEKTKTKEKRRSGHEELMNNSGLDVAIRRA